MQKNNKNYRNIRVQMFNRGMSQRELAKEMGLGVTTINRKLTGKTPWLLDECLLLAKIFGTTLDNIFLPKGFPHGNNTKKIV